VRNRNSAVDHDNHLADGRTPSAYDDVRDYVILLKPRVMSLVLFTAFVGLVLAPGNTHPVLSAIGLLCIAVGAGASGAINMWYDADIDIHMKRTRGRPIPAGRVPASEALTLGVILSLASVGIMGLLVNLVAAILLAVTIGFYVFIYTMWLKRRTPQNIVIGGAAGAFPPMVGWAVSSGEIGLGAIALFALIFMWTPPHFWALALYRSEDYKDAGVPMLPVVAGKAETRKQILIYTVGLAVVSLAPAAVGIAGWLYLAGAVVLSGVFLYMAIAVFLAGDHGEAPAKRLFKFSILYLFILFALLLVERVIALQPFVGIV
jgi:protoheme IX farnesyltransferase